MGILILFLRLLRVAAVFCLACVFAVLVCRVCGGEHWGAEDPYSLRIVGIGVLVVALDQFGLDRKRKSRVIRRTKTDKTGTKRRKLHTVVLGGVFLVLLAYIVLTIVKSWEAIWLFFCPNQWYRQFR